MRADFFVGGGARYRRHGQIDLIAPRVPPRELREQVLPARRQILHFAKNGAPGKFSIPPESRCADAADWLAVSHKKLRRRRIDRKMSAPPRERKTRASVTNKAATSKDAWVSAAGLSAGLTKAEPYHE